MAEDLDKAIRRIWQPAPFIGAIALWSVSVLAPLAAWADGDAPAPPASGGKETVCDDRKDDDGDGMTDCADADCAAAPRCKPGQGDERSDDACSDWVDNDGDGAVDCDDADCEANGIQVCRGSWKGPHEGSGAKGQVGSDEELPDLGNGQTVEDLIGKGGDKDGERNDEVCSDGVDNDRDGKADCADFGCRFDPSVTVCRGNPGMRFSVVAGISQAYHLKSYKLGDDKMDTEFSRIQLRSFGPMPMIQDSFYLLSLRAEKTPRLTFAMFQMPIGNHGTYLNINSGGGGLSAALITSVAKQLLLDPAYYVYSAFEQGNGASVEMGGTAMDGKIGWRAFVAGGAGRSSGNVGGRYFTYDNTNYTYAGGAQAVFNIIGTLSRFDTPFLYTTVPTTLGLALGVKYDQRSQERFVGINGGGTFRSGRLVIMAENYSKQEFEFDSFQTAYVVQVGFLAIPRVLLLAADFGEYLPGEMKNPPAKLETDLLRQLAERQWRAAAHVYLVRNIGLLSLVYVDRTVANSKVGLPANQERNLRLEAQYRF